MKQRKLFAIFIMSAALAAGLFTSIRSDAAAFGSVGPYNTNTNTRIPLRLLTNNVQPSVSVSNRISDADFAKQRRHPGWQTNAFPKVGTQRRSQKEKLVLTEVGPDFEVWSKPTNTLSQATQSAAATNRQQMGRGQVVKLATGMNFWDGSKWARSEASFHPSPAGDAFVADRVQHSTRLAADINTDGAVTVTLPDGTGVLHSTPVAIALYDPASGKAAMLASITNSTATLISSNRVLYPDAFRENGVCASVLYTIKNGSFAQDVVFTGHFDPRDYGFPAESQIQVFTEVYDHVQPGQIERKIPDQHPVNARRPDRIDHLLDFGKFVLGAGRAHSMFDGVIGTNLDTPVTKEFKVIQGRRFIIESLEVAPLLSVFQALPLCSETAELKSKFKNASIGYALIPRAGFTVDTGTAQAEFKHPVVSARVQLAIGSIAPSGLVLDYHATLNSAFQPTIFKSDVTYYVAGQYFCNGPATIEAACFKFPYYSGADYNGIPSTSASITFNDTVTCKTSEYFPAVCTSADDESRGESLAGDCPGEGCSPIYPYWTGTVQGYYGSPCFLMTYSSATISNVFFHYAAEAIRFNGSSAAGGTPYTLADSQIVSCQTAITLTGLLSAPNQTNDDQTAIPPRSFRLLANLFGLVGGVAYCDAPPPPPGQPYNIDINNCLLVTNKNPITITVPVNAHFNHCTFDQDQVPSPGPLVSSTSPAGLTTPTATFVNCALANLPTKSAGLVTVGGDHNGFYNCFGNTTFGDNPVPTSNYPFQAPAPGYGAYYLATESEFRNAGTTLLSPAIINDLKTRCVDPPDWIQDNTLVTLQMTLKPHIYRYSTVDAPHLGYWYAALDYVFGKVVVDSAAPDTVAAVVIEPGTALAVNAPNADTYWSFGFVLAGNSSVVAHGNPTNPITITTVESVQERQFSPGLSFAFVPAWWYEFSPDDYYNLLPPLLSFRFCNFYFPQWGFPLCSGHDASGQIFPGDQPISVGSTMRLSLQDCTLHGGGLAIERPIFRLGDSGSGFPHMAPGSFSCVNNLFDRVGVFLHPTAYSEHFVDAPAIRQMDFSIEAYNNLFRGGWVSYEPAPSSHGDWTFRDNMFDKVSFIPSSYPPLPLDHDYNAYWLWGDNEQDPEWHPEWGQIKRLTVDPLQMTTAPHDVVFNSAPAYQNGTFGSFYLASSAPTVNVGSRTPAEAHLFQYTTRTDNVKDGEETGPAKVNIGMHYVAASSGAPKSTLVSGIPDYVSDADGNGLVDSTEFNLPATTYLSPKLKANNDFLQLPPNGRLTVDINDIDSSGQPRTIVYPPSATTTLDTPHGKINAGPLFRRVTYTPNAGFWGSDTFTYMIVNDYNQESSATCKVFINQAGNTPPVAVDHNFPSYSPGALITISLLAGCTDANGDTLTVDSVTPPPYGFIVSGPNSAGQIQYFLDDFMAGPDIFQYVITDGKGGMSMATVTVTPNNGGNHAPIALSFSTTAKVNQDLNIRFMAHDPDDPTDPNGNNLYYSWSGPSHGSIVNVVGPHNGPNFTYRPDPDFVGEDSLIYIGYDGTLQSTNATIFIKVQPDNSEPVALNGSYSGFLNTDIQITLPAYDLDGDALTFTFDQPNQTGASVDGTAPNLTYHPPPDFEGDDYFYYTVTDGKETPVQGIIYVKVTRVQWIQLLGTYTDYTLKANMTYVIASTVIFNGTTTIEGGTVVKYYPLSGEVPKLVINGPVICQTSPLRPAIFTATDDTSVGYSFPGAGDPFGYYCDTALEMPNTGNTDLRYLRIAYANTAIHYPGTISSDVSDSVRHLQFVNCGTTFLVEGTASHNRTLAIRNCLLSGVEQAFAGSHWNATAEHLTVDYCTTGLLPDPASATFNLLVTNSVFSRLFHVEANDPNPLVNIDGDFNGFDQGATTFGYHPVTDSMWPFAPPTSLATAQGWYYLRGDSPFLQAGTPGISSKLKADLVNMTWQVPHLLTNDITSSQTLSPAIPRTLAAPTSYPLGYHYPLIDYIVNGATVNNCTLNIDQGTILAFTSPANFYPIYEWGLRVNPGGRLNVYGVPTNRVVFTRLEGIHEDAVPGYQQFGGPLITFKGVFLPSGTMVTPLPEAHIHYADFPVLAGNAVHFGPMLFEGVSTYDCVGNLELNGCLFQAGDLLYESGGPQNRTLTFRNNIFERSTIEVMNRQQPAGRGYEETFTAVNNLFYDSDVWLTDVSSSGASWTFTDNLFDNSTFHGANKVAVNHNNGYVNMATHHLSPSTQTGSNPDVSSLAYDFGPLGRFYLPGSATTLLAGGSRSAGGVGGAGLYHFTCQASNAKLLLNTVNIGPSYLALIDTAATLINASSLPMDFKVSATPVTTGPGNLSLNASASMTITPSKFIYAWDAGATGPPKGSATIPGNSDYLGQIVWDGNAFTFRNSAADSNGDGVPDFIADRNGDGNEDGEMQWMAGHLNTDFAILSPAVGTIVHGIVKISVNLGGSAANIDSLSLLVDGKNPPAAISVKRPSRSIVELEFDTRYLMNGERSVVVWYGTSTSGGLQAAYSAPITIIVDNAISQPLPEGRAGNSITLNLHVPPSPPAFTLYFLNSTFAKAYDLSAISATRQGTVEPDGGLSFSESIAGLGLPDGDTSPTIFPITELGTGAAALATPNFTVSQFSPWPSFVGLGWWAAAYADDAVDYKPIALGPGVFTAKTVADKYSYNINPLTLAYNDFWYHGVQLDSGWRLCGPLSSAGTQITLAADPNVAHPEIGQTWPLRAGFLNYNGADFALLMTWLGSPAVRNFYGLGHGSPQTFFSQDWSGFAGFIKHRYRFVFLDGCETALGSGFGAFGATGDEMKYPVYPSSEWSVLSPTITYYNATGFRPAAFVGWKAAPYNTFPNPGTIDDRTGVPCAHECLEALCNWHSQFLFKWVFGAKLLDAIDFANELAFGVGSNPPIPPGLTCTILQSDGSTTTVSFDPRTCLRVCGYGDLKFNEYNRYGDWSQ